MVQKKTPVKHKRSVKRKPRGRKPSGKRIKSLRKRLGIVVIRLFVLGLILFALFFTAVYLGFLGYLPTAAQLREIRNPQASEVFAGDGRLLGRYYVENRSNVRYEEISPDVIHALIATEDARFYEHRGIDEVALLRVLFRTLLLHDRGAGGGSTLSQQIAKNLFPRNELWLFSMPANKLREAIIAYRLERIYTKEEILTLYLNTVPFGENIFGIEVAAERYFSRHPRELNVGEAAVLVGMLKANNRYNPRLNPEKSLERRNVVIGQMVKNEYLTEAEGEAFKARPLGLRYRRISYNEGPAPYFLEMLKPELLEWCRSHTREDGEPYNLYTDGLKIRTTINYDFQRFAREAVREQMKSLQGVFDSHWNAREPWAKNPAILERAIRRSERYKKMKAAGCSEKEILNAFSHPVQTTLHDWNGDRQREVSPLDSLKHYLRMLNAGFIALDPATGDLKAWVGGIDFRVFKYDHVTALRQAGSTFKPFVYLAALEKGISPCAYFSNERRIYPQYQNWSPRNSHDHYTGYYSMEGALAKSVNTVAVDVLMQTGLNQVIRTSGELGIEQELPAFPSLALGVASVSLKEMAVAYATILNGGRRVTPYYLVSVSDSRGQLLAEFPRPAPQLTSIAPENCRILVHMLQAVVRDGTGAAVRSRYRLTGDFAGKTGTTQDHSDGWFFGMSPDLVAGCWVGGEDPGIHFRSITYGQGAYMALPVVGKFYSKLYREQSYRNLACAKFPQPSAKVLAQLDIPAFLETSGPFPGKLPGNGLKKQEADKQVDKKHKEKKKDKRRLWDVVRDIFGKKK
ncbi:MAG: penicillin-binding protein 1A [Mangrovibacterium sp.]